MPERKDSTTSPSTSIFSSFSAIRVEGYHCPGLAHFHDVKSNRDVLARNGHEGERVEELVIPEDSRDRVWPPQRVDDRARRVREPAGTEQDDSGDAFLVRHLRHRRDA